MDILVEIRGILEMMQSDSGTYGGRDNPNVRIQVRRIAELLEEIHDARILAHEIPVTTYGGRGHRYDTTWRLVGPNDPAMIFDRSGNGSQNQSFCTQVAGGALECHLTMTGWDGTIPGESWGNERPSMGWFESQIMFMNRLIAVLDSNLKKTYGRGRGKIASRRKSQRRRIKKRKTKKPKRRRKSRRKH